MARFRKSALILVFSAVSAQAGGNVVVLDIKGGIGVATAEYILSGIEHAETSGAELIIINMDTPGGLMAPMRDIVQAILGSSVPVATYVTPAGARADSAGTYILLASHVAVMTPTTHLGAATPVALGGDDATPKDSDDEESAEGPRDRGERGGDAVGSELSREEEQKGTGRERVENAESLHPARIERAARDEESEQRVREIEGGCLNIGGVGHAAELIRIPEREDTVPQLFREVGAVRVILIKEVLPEKRSIERETDQVFPEEHEEQ